MHPLTYAAGLEASFRKRFASRFYSQIELAPGKFTEGTSSRNIALTRTLLGRTDIEGKDCADVTAADGWCTLLMERRRAARVAGFDRNDFTPLIDKVRAAFGCSFQYFPLLKADEIPDAARQAGFDGFDVVVNSGLLYHVLGPINALAATRSLVKTGGILIVETVFDAESDGYTMKFNHAGSLNRTDPTFFWSISVKMFEYLLRLLRLQPIDAVFVADRMAIACRAVAEVPADPADGWIDRTYAARDVLDFTDWSILDRTTDVSYTAPELPSSPASGVDVWKIFQTQGELPNAYNLVKIGLTDTV